MKTQILFIHGAGGGAYKEDKKLAESLQQSLGSSFEVRFPKMKNEEDADYDTWAEQIKEELAKFEDGAIVVGHSVGASVLIKLLSVEKLDTPIKAVYLIASPFWGGNGGWTYEGYKTLELPAKSDSKFPDGVPIFLYHSKDDETVPFGHLALFKKSFPAATAREFDKGGHQMNEDLSAVAKDIK